jgi:hypothetical protein
MSESNDIYAICGRIKNIVARKDLALSSAGTILVNTYALVLKELHDFSEKLPVPYNEELRDLLIKKETLPGYVIELSTPKRDYVTLYEEVMNTKAQFETNEKALEHFTKEYEDLGSKYGVTGDEFWQEAEDSINLTEDHQKIMRLSRSIQMCKYLIKKDNSGCVFCKKCESHMCQYE